MQVESNHHLICRKRHFPTNRKGIGTVWGCGARAHTGLRLGGLSHLSPPCQDKTLKKYSYSIFDVKKLK